VQEIGTKRTVEGIHIEPSPGRADDPDIDLARLITTKREDLASLERSQKLRLN
tara:strand:- start:429 stop:587 length:159 start_codon:yes stop_codon:yes gene_type:complete